MSWCCLPQHARPVGTNSQTSLCTRDVYSGTTMDTDTGVRTYSGVSSSSGPKSTLSNIAVEYELQGERDGKARETPAEEIDEPVPKHVSDAVEPDAAERDVHMTPAKPNGPESPNAHIVLSARAERDRLGHTKPDMAVQCPALQFRGGEALSIYHVQVAYGVFLDPKTRVRIRSLHTYTHESAIWKGTAKQAHGPGGSLLERRVILKTIPIESKSRYYQFIRQTSIIHLCSKNGVAPPLAGYCMTRDPDSPRVLYGHILYVDVGTPLQTGSLNPSELLQLFSLVGRMHRLGVWHHDLFMKNLIAEPCDNTGNRRIYIIDYGMSIFYPGGVSDPLLRACDFIGLIAGYLRPKGPSGDIMLQRKKADEDHVIPFDIMTPLYDWKTHGSIELFDWCVAALISSFQITYPILQRALRDRVNQNGRIILGKPMLMYENVRGGLSCDGVSEYRPDKKLADVPAENLFGVSYRVSSMYAHMLEGMSSAERQRLYEEDLMFTYTPWSVFSTNKEHLRTSALFLREEDAEDEE